MSQYNNAPTNGQKKNQSINIMDTAIEGLNPSSVVFDVRSGTIENFMLKMLEAENINGVKTVIVHNRNEGRDNARVYINLVVSKNSNMFVGKSNRNSNVPDNISRRMDGTAMRLTENGKKALRPYVGNDRDIRIQPLQNKGGEGLVTIQLGIFRVLAAVLLADTRYFDLDILKSFKLPDSNTIILKVAKVVKYQGGNNNSSANYYKMVVDSTR